MEKLFIQGTDDTPEVLFDLEGNTYSIKGRSLPEDAIKFFAEPMSWIKAFGQYPKPMTLDIQLDYFNSSSAKQIVEILIVLEGLKEKGLDVKVNWLYELDDELMMTRGKEIATIVEVPFVFSGIQSES